MPAKTSVITRPAERGHIAFDVNFFDENNTPVVPTAITWTLTDILGNVINGRENIEVTPAADVTLVLQGNDLAITDTDVRRFLLIEWTFTSTIGTNIPGKMEISFTIDNLVAVS